MPSTTPCANVAIGDPKKNARSHQCRARVYFRRNSKATPRKIRPSSISSNGKYTAGMMIANASGKIASSPTPTEHQPRLVAVPDRRHGASSSASRVVVARHRKENADAEVEAIEQHVHEHGDAEDDRPHRHQVERSWRRLPKRRLRARQRPRRRSPSFGSRSSTCSGGPARTRRDHVEDSRAEYDQISDRIQRQRQRTSLPVSDGDTASRVRSSP